MRYRVKHVFWDHLPIWFMVIFGFAFAAFDIWAMMNQAWIYAPEPPNELP